MKVVALIPIKHHSSRVPGKNYRLMNGKPLYYYVINTLSRTISEIVINVDNQELGLQIQKDFPNVLIYHRPDSLKGDDVPTNLLFLDMIETLKYGKETIFLQTHVTNPLVKLETFEQAIEIYNKNTGNDTLFSVKRLQTRLYNKNGEAMNHNPTELIPTQDLDPVYEENSCIYIFTYDSLKKHNHRIGSTPYIYEMSDLESQDIDYEFDFKITEILMREVSIENERRIIVITGSSGGIGSSIVRYFKKLGWITVGIDISESSEADCFYQLDMSKDDMSEYERIVTTIGKKYGRIDLLVNNAAIQICKKWDDYQMEDWNKTFNVNLKSCYVLSKLCKQCLSKSNGSIVNICSVHSIATSAGIGLYALSKGALLTLTRSMSLEYIKDGVRVNSISPGAIDTPMLRKGIERNPSEGWKKLEQSCPAGRVGKPEEIASAVHFAYQNEFMVGENLVIDGGATIKLSTE